jgi:REP element-mobilizing transposase RayT
MKVSPKTGRVRKADGRWRLEQQTSVVLVVLFRARMRRPRRREPGLLAEVTVRCNRGEFRFLPNDERRSILGYWLAKAQRRYPGVECLSAVQMSNHIHLCFRDREGQLSAFLQYALGHCAKSINKLDHVRGAVFERRFSEITIVDLEALVKRIAYAVTNPVEANLVRSHREWTGLCLYSGKEPVRHRFTVFREDRYQRALRDAERTGAYVNRSEFFEAAELEIAHLEEGLADEVAGAIEAREAELRARQTGVLGMQRVLQSSPFDRPKMSARSRMPLCFASSREAWRAFADGWFAFVGAFRHASAAFRAGRLDTVFPRFSFRPITSTA